MIKPGLVVGEWEIPETELIEIFDTSGGPGGQHANRNRTVVTLRIDLTTSTMPLEMSQRIRDRLGADVVTVTAGESRSQWRNRALARARIKKVLEDALRPEKRRRPTKPTRASRQRRIESKRRRSETKKNRQTPDAW